MILAVYKTHGCDPNNKRCPRLQPKKTKEGKAVLVISIAAKGIIRTVHYQQDGVL